MHLLWVLVLAMQAHMASGLQRQFGEKGAILAVFRLTTQGLLDTQTFFLQGQQRESRLTARKRRFSL
ncbi:MAG: hypothetical protein EAX95_11680 [Candidatus Thorarchaeota archaeon]|nr:hypothetical protein [Candidatus Thorarchaeota archaeon]